MGNLTKYWEPEPLQLPVIDALVESSAKFSVRSAGALCCVPQSKKSYKASKTLALKNILTQRVCLPPLSPRGFGSGGAIVQFHVLIIKYKK